MALTMEGLRKLLEAVQLPYFIAPDRPAIMVGGEGMFGRYQVVIPLEMEGRFMQFRTIGYLRCTGDHKHLSEVLKVLAVMNYNRRLVKFGWDSTDGEIVAYADLWLMDGNITVEQFRRMVQNYFSVIDLGCGRIRAVLETGKDPGDMDPQEMMRAATASGGLPEQVRKIMEKLLGKKGPDDSPKSGPDFSRI